MKISHHGRPICADDDCGAEIERARKYCAGHQYLIDRWIEHSKIVLAAAMAKDKGEHHGR